MKHSSARSFRSLAALLALCLVPLLAACPAEPEADANDAGTLADAGEPADAGAPDDAGTSVGPAPGELGGACAAGYSCTEGECTTLSGDLGSRCTRACSQNADCPESLRCEATSDHELFCLYGPRGTSGVGQPCGTQKGLGCTSGLCIDADPEEEIPVDTCTARCLDDSGCAVPFPFCHPYYGLCFPIGSGVTGGICRFDGTCFDDNACTALEGVGERCTRTCTATADCGSAYLECKDFGGTSYCVMKSGS